MRILFVTPYPPSRIRVRSYGFLTQLQREHEVTIATQVASEQELTDVEALRTQGFAVVTIEESKRQAVLRSGMALLGSLPLQVAYARSQRFTQAVQELGARRTFDVLHVEHLRGIASMEPLAKAHPLVWDAVDCISLLSKQTIVGGPSLPVRTVALLEHKRTQRYEGRIVHMLPHVLVTSERDRQAMIELRRTQTGNATGNDEATEAGIRVLPNGVDLAYFSPLNQEQRRFNVVFSGKMSYHANVATALYLYRQIMPLIWQQQPETTLTIVGSKPPPSIQQLARDPRVEVTGYVDDLRPYVGRAQVMLSPMVYSVGIQNKVLEAMALGTPVVVAAQAAAALGTRPGRDLMVASSANEFAELTLRLMNDAELHATLSRCGRTYVEQQHDWRLITDRLVNVYQQAILAHTGGSTSFNIATSFPMPSKSI
ncbi:MAG TPA: glycosyltransferase [Ktedonobacteraceae bacterium]|nr:glycosyltransferase [Ktedonobacteraceae bacterium]